MKSGVHQTTITVTSESIDGNGHVNNVEYIRWMQDAATQHAVDTGAFKAALEAGSAWVTRSHKIEYLRPAFEGDQIFLLTWISSIGTVRALRKYKFLRGKDKTVLAEGMTDWVCVRRESGRPQKIPESVQTAFEVVPEDLEP